MAAGIYRNIMTDKSSLEAVWDKDKSGRGAKYGSGLADESLQKLKSLHENKHYVSMNVENATKSNTYSLRNNERS